MIFGAPANSSFLVDQSIQKLDEKMLEDAITRAKEYGVPKIVEKILRKKVCCVVCGVLYAQVRDESDGIVIR